MAHEVGDTATGEPGADEPSPGAPSERPSAPSERPSAPSERPSAPSERPSAPSERPSAPSDRPGDGTPPSTGRHRADSGHHPLPPALRPGATGPRLDGLDAGRGVAVLAMLVLLGRLGTPSTLAEYLAAPLFVGLVGAAMGTALARPGVGRARLVVDNVLRGLLLVLLGVGLQAVTAEVDVVLPALGLLVVVLAPLALLLRPVPVLGLAVVVAGAVLGPLAIERARDAVASGPAASGPVGDLLDWTAAGADHRVVSFLPMALAGVFLAPLLLRLAGPVTAGVVAVVLLAAAVTVHAIGTGTVDGVAPSSGTTAEVVAATFLAAAVVVAAVAVVLARDDLPRLRPVLRPLLAPVLALGRLALTAYTLEVLLLALASAVGDPGPGDGTAVRLALAVVVVSTCWLLDRRLGAGPLEVLVRVARVPARGRHGGALTGRRPPRGPGSRR